MHGGRGETRGLRQSRQSPPSLPVILRHSEATGCAVEAAPGEGRLKADPESRCDQWDNGNSEDSAGGSDTEVVKCSPGENNTPAASGGPKILLSLGGIEFPPQEQSLA